MFHKHSRHKVSQGTGGVGRNHLASRGSEFQPQLLLLHNLPSPNKQTTHKVGCADRKSNSLVFGYIVNLQLAWATETCLKRKLLTRVKKYQVVVAWTSSRVKGFASASPFHAHKAWVNRGFQWPPWSYHWFSLVFWFFSPSLPIILREVLVPECPRNAVFLRGTQHPPVPQMTESSRKKKAFGIIKKRILFSAWRLSAF